MNQYSLIPEQLRKEGFVHLALPEAMRQMESLAIWVNKETNDLFCRSGVKKGTGHKRFMQLQLKHSFLSPVNQIFSLLV